MSAIEILKKKISNPLKVRNFNNECNKNFHKHQNNSRKKKKYEVTI